MKLDGSIQVDYDDTLSDDEEMEVNTSSIRMTAHEDSLKVVEVF